MKYASQLTPDIFRLTFPFKDIYTSVGIVMTPEGVLVYDAASYSEDMEEILFPALEEIGIEKDSLRYILISHNHGDHAGGLSRFLQEFPYVTVISPNDDLKAKHPEASFFAPKDGERILGCLQVIFVPGHTANAMALLDTRTGTLLSGDSLQLYGIFGSGLWGSNISFPKAHLEAVEKLRRYEINTVCGAHDFYPCGYLAQGKEEVGSFLDACRDSLLQLKAYLGENLSLSDEELAEAFNASHSLPTVGRHVFRNLRRDFFLSV